MAARNQGRIGPGTMQYLNQFFFSAESLSLQVVYHFPTFLLKEDEKGDASQQFNFSKFQLTRRIGFCKILAYPENRVLQNSSLPGESDFAQCQLTRRIGFCKMSTYPENRILQNSSLPGESDFEKSRDNPCSKCVNPKMDNTHNISLLVSPLPEIIPLILACWQTSNACRYC